MVYKFGLPFFVSVYPVPLSASTADTTTSGASNANEPSGPGEPSKLGESKSNSSHSETANHLLDTLEQSGRSNALTNPVTGGSLVSSSPLVPLDGSSVSPIHEIQDVGESKHEPINSTLHDSDGNAGGAGGAGNAGNAENADEFISNRFGGPLSHQRPTYGSKSGQHHHQHGHSGHHCTHYHHQ